MKIIGGLAKGHQLVVPKTIRPTSSLLRRKLFDAYQNWEEVNFVDLCAGSGSIGFEAWSRQAKSVYLVEQKNKPGPLKALKKNKEALCHRFPEEVKKRPLHITNAGVISWFSWWQPSKTTVLYFDPPYHFHKLYLKSLQALKNANTQGILWIQSSKHSSIDQKTISSFFHIDKIYTHSHNILYKAVF